MKIETVYTFDMYEGYQSDIYLKCTSKALPIVGEFFTYTYKERERSTLGVVTFVGKYTLSDGNTFILFKTHDDGGGIHPEELNLIF